MPLYEYKCGQCEQLFEVIQKFSDEPLTVHEGCGGAVERVLSAPALQFKGSGWYITDYARGGSGGNKASGKNGGDSDTSKSGDSKSGESKSGGSKTSSSESSSSSSSGSGSSSASSSDAKK
jgi:putative FmdB family regulatory protein